MKKIFSTLFFALVICFTMFTVDKASAMEFPSDLPSFNFNSSKSYLVYGDYLIQYDPVNYLYLTHNSNSTNWYIAIKNTSASSSKINIYRLNNGTWIHSFDTTNGANGAMGFSDLYSASSSDIILEHIYYSTDDIYSDYDKTSVFFPLPQVETEVVEPLPILPQHQVAILTATETPKMATKVVGTMKVLLLCGVGLIALLVALKLFGKLFRIFQVR